MSETKTVDTRTSVGAGIAWATFWLALALVVSTFVVGAFDEHRLHHECALALVEEGTEYPTAITACEGEPRQ